MSRSISIHYNGQSAGGIKHWKFGLHEEDGSTTLFDIVGDVGNWTPRVKQQNPRNSSNYQGNTPLCDISDSQQTMSIIMTIVQHINAGLNSQGAGYDCQDYVLEILDELVNNRIIDPNNEEYVEGRDEVKDNYGK
jgi:hypothetical protein